MSRKQRPKITLEMSESIIVRVPENQMLTRFCRICQAKVRHLPIIRAALLLGISEIAAFRLAENKLLHSTETETGANASQTAQIETFQTNQPNLPAATSLQRFWRITTDAGITSANLMFNYLQTDVAGNENTYRINRISGGVPTGFPNDCGAGSPCVNTVNNTATINNVTQFSDWTLAEFCTDCRFHFGRRSRRHGRRTHRFKCVSDVDRTERRNALYKEIMARKIILTASGKTPLFNTANETSVGKGGSNSRRSDIQLVQFFLKQFYAKNPAVFKRLPGSSGGPFAIDGVCGAQTKTGILLFQQKMRGDGNAIGIDGLVDAPKGWKASISKLNYTISWLNKWFKENGDGTEHYETLENHPDIVNYAPELKAELSIVSNAATVG